MMKKTSTPELPLRKPNSTLVMIPTVKRLTPTGRKIFNYLFHKAQITVAELKKNGEFFRAGSLFSAPLKELADFLSENKAESNDAGMRSLLLKHLTELQETHVTWSAPDAKSGVIWARASLLSEAKYEIKDGEHFIRWSFPPCIFTELENPGQYTPIQISQIAKLRLYQSICLYEICTRYKNNFAGKTCNNSPEWWVEALSSMPKSEYSKPKIWRQIKSSVLDSILEINEQTDLTLHMREFKTGKAVTSIQFTVAKKDDLVIKEINSEHVAALNQAARLGVNIDIALTNAKPTEVEFALNKLEGQKSKVNIDKPQAYFNKILKELPTSVIKTVSSKAITKTPDFDEESTSAPDSSIFSVMQTEFLNLPFTDRLHFCELVVADAGDNPLFTKKMIEKIKSGDLNSSLIKIVAVRYALEVHGLNIENQASLSTI